MDRVPPAYADLAASWKPGTTPDRTLVEETRGALLIARPGDLPGVAELVARLDACLGSPETREPSRRALFGLCVQGGIVDLRLVDQLGVIPEIHVPQLGVPVEAHRPPDEGIELPNQEIGQIECGELGL